ncbi:DNA-binding protein [Ramlibacter alkalitolerans]|uniref:DNA-binding protein n=1 Tax=Ramlibacter alkalitolerans TaxID=2039631 RepID=A0ABS1JU32_9BURK|nr:DNA-binding protein [Ramlibacter alkalitolerans]MBL0427764.1 DNA-binding protein [Ramlibacter alkalitolerans]
MDTSAVFRAADALYARGTRPTVRAVRDELGGGSFKHISPALSAWWKQPKHAQTPAAAAPQEAEDHWAEEREKLVAEAAAREKLAYDRLEGTRRHLLLQADTDRQRVRQLEAELAQAREVMKAQRDEVFLLKNMLRQARNAAQAQTHTST